MTDLYDRDFYAWTQAQADAIARRDSGRLEWERLEEEVRSIGSQLRSELTDRLQRALRGLLDWRLSRRWELDDLGETEFNLDMVRAALKSSPSLLAYYFEEFEAELQSARNFVELRYGEGAVAGIPLFSAAQLIDPGYNIYAWGRGESQAA